jgi:hypothetical protein
MHQCTSATTTYGVMAPPWCFVLRMVGVRTPSRLGWASTTNLPVSVRAHEVWIRSFFQNAKGLYRVYAGAAAAAAAAATATTHTRGKARQACRQAGRQWRAVVSVQ